MNEPDRKPALPRPVAARLATLRGKPPQAGVADADPKRGSPQQFGAVSDGTAAVRVGTGAALATVSGLVVGVGLAVAPAGPADVVAAPQIELAQPPGFAPAPVDGTRTGQAGGPAGASNLTVSVEPGTLAVFDPRSEIAVARVAGSDWYTGVISGLRIADARGSGAGWRLTVIVTSVHTSDGSVTARTVNAHVRRLVGFAESASGLHAEAGTAVAGGHRALIATADPRHGMGAFDVTATIAVRLRDASFSRGWAQLRFGLV